MAVLSVIMVFSLAIGANAAQTELFDSEKERLETGISDEERGKLSSIGVDGIDDITENGVDTSRLFSYAWDELKSSAPAPLSALIVLLCVVIVASAAEAYTYSLRYTHTKEIMGVAVSVFIASVLIVPAAELAADTAAVIGAASKLLMIYLPIMAGLMAFSGQAVGSAGYYTAVVTGAGLLSKLSSTILAPLLNGFLSLAVCDGICGRIHLRGLIEFAAKAFKWLLTFSVSMFTAVVGMNSALSGAADGLTGRAAKFALTSLVPLIGSSLAEAYQTIRGSLGLLRAGMGVFVIISLFISFAPLLARALLWSLAAGCARLTAEAFGVSSASEILNAVSIYLSAVRALIYAVMIAFVFSSAVLIRLGGAG